MTQLTAIDRLIAECEAAPRKAPSAALVAAARVELDAFRLLSRLLRRLGAHETRKACR